MKGKTVFVGMSGGVDSSVAAHLLKKQGYNVVGVFMRCYNVDSCAEQDAEDARRVAEKIGIPFYAWDFEEEYKKRVVEYMVEGYRAGLTPNPDVMCNREIKFGLFLKKALALGANYVATGHYVRLAKRGGAFRLSQADDTNKDQSYFLWTLTQGDLAHCLFPIGGYKKPEVRVLAKKAGLPTAEKKDSQGICFLGQVSIADFLSAYIPQKRGAIVTPDGAVVGEHHGAHFVTVGQRSGVGQVIHRKGEQAVPHYVVSKDVKKNIVTVAEGHDHDLLFKKELALTAVNILSGEAAQKDMRVFARVRYRQPVSAATLVAGKKVKLVFDAPQQFVAEGQSAVWYSKAGEMLGGAVIAKAK
jgi:tRNA-specific 2-thiouridylase